MYTQTSYKQLLYFLPSGGYLRAGVLSLSLRLVQVPLIVPLSSHRAVTSHQSCFISVHEFQHGRGSAGEVGRQRDDVVIEGGVLGVARAGHLELLGGVGELESSVWMGRVGQHGALSLQQLGHSFQELPEAESQGGFT